MAWLVTSCAAVTPSPPPVKDAAPSSPPIHLKWLPDPAITDEPRSRWGNHSPYTVLGRRYDVWPSRAGYDEVGVASWYGTKFHGRRTSNGETFNMYQLTAAHRHLPLPAFVRVTNLDNGASSVVRVNDRGPFHSGRILDVSYATAVKLGFADRGTARVRVTSVVPQRPPVIAPRIFIQAGAYGELAAADRAKLALRGVTGHDVFVVKKTRDPLFRVRIGPLADERGARRLLALVTERHADRAIIVEE